MQLDKGSQAVKLSSLRITSHEAEQRVIGEEGSSWTESGWSCDWGKSWAAGREESVGDVEEIFGASFSRKGTLNSALINLKEQELLEVKVTQAFSFVFSIWLTSRCSRYSDTIRGQSVDENLPFQEALLRSTGGRLNGHPAFLFLPSTLLSKVLTNL